MFNKKIQKKIMLASKLSAKGKHNRAVDILNKTKDSSIDPNTHALLDYHLGICETALKNYSEAGSLLSLSSSYFDKSNMTEQAYNAYIMLGKVLCKIDKYDDACDAFIKAEGFTSDISKLCEAKTLLSEARMSSETVYDTNLFTDSFEFIKEHYLNNEPVDKNFLIRSCVIAAKACYAINQYGKAIEYCNFGLDNTSDIQETTTISKRIECAELLCFCAASTWSKEVISDAAKITYNSIRAYDIHDEKTDFIRLFYIIDLIKTQNTDDAKPILRSIDRNTLSSKLNLCFVYCECVSSNIIFDLQKINRTLNLIPTDDIDDHNILAESIIDAGFYELAAEVYIFSLSNYKTCQSLILRPLASLLYKLERFDESAKYYSELISECDEPVLRRAYALASIKSGDIETAKKQMLHYIKHADDEDEALSTAARVSLDEGFPSDFCASLYSRLAEIIERKDADDYEAVDIFNRLGICLYKSNYPLEDETNAFKKAAEYANKCAATKNSNLHAVILCNLAECYLRKGSMDESYNTYMEADRIFSELEDIDYIQYSACLKFISDILLLRNDTDSAIDSLNKAIALLEPYSSSDPSAARQLSLCHNTLGTIYFKQGKPELEIPELSKAIDLVKDQSIDCVSLAMLYSNRGEAYEFTGKYDYMVNDYSNFLSLTSNADKNADILPEIRISQASKWLSIGRYRENSLQHNEAIAAYHNALDILDNIKLSDNTEVNELTAFSYYQLGNAYCHQNIKNFSSGLDAYTRALNILEELPPSTQRRIHLASVYEARSAFYEIFGEHSLSVYDSQKAEILRTDTADNTI